MRIQKVISGAQTGADRAALDFAIDYGIEHGGWVPQGRRAEDGVIAAKYQVWELPEGGYAQRTEKNVLEADATLIISHGELTGGSLLTRRLSEKYSKPCLHVDLTNVITFDAAIDIHEWIDTNDIRVLNVAGPRASKDSGIYRITYDILVTLFHIDIIAAALPSVMKRTGDQKYQDEDGLPRTLEEAVDDLMNRLTGVEKIRIASKGEAELGELAESWGKFIRRRFLLKKGNLDLIADCRSHSGDPDLDAEEAAGMILNRLWERLRKTGHLRVVK